MDHKLFAGINRRKIYTLAYCRNATEAWTLVKIGRQCYESRWPSNQAAEAGGCPDGDKIITGSGPSVEIGAATRSSPAPEVGP